MGALPQLPYALWFRRCFAGCLPESSLQRSVTPDSGSSQVFDPADAGANLWRRRFLLRVWDKVISGSCKILVFVALEILLSYKMVLMGASRPDGVGGFLRTVSETQCGRLRPQASRLRLLPSDAAGEHGRHREQSHRPVAQVLWHPRARRVAPRS